MTEKQLKDEELKQVLGGMKVDGGEDNFNEITQILTECGNIAWAIEPWNSLWEAINEAEKTDSKSVRGIRLEMALGTIDLYKTKLGTQYEYLLERLQYCLAETKK